MGWRKIFGMAGLVLFGGLHAAFAGIATFSGTGQVEDTYLRGDDTQISSAHNYGGSDILIVGNLNSAVAVNALARFTDLSSLSGQTVTNATLRLYNYNHANQTRDVTIDIYEVAAANGDWVEGTALGAVQTGSSDWRFKIQNSAGWAGGRKGCGVAGTDYETHLVGRAVSTNTTAEWVEFALDASVVQNWIDNPNQNRGLLLTAPGAAIGGIAYFRSSESSYAGLELVVEVEGILSEEPYFSVSSVFSDYMVLQRDQAVPIWGWASSGTVVNVALDGVPSGTAVPDETGKWTAWIDAHPADGGQPHALLVSADGFSDVQIGNVVFGDVYLASGQSNMATLMNAFTNSAKYPPEVNTLYAGEIAAANHPLIRQLAIRAKASASEWDEPAIRSPWETCSPSTVPGFTAVGYFFAREVHLETGVPVGLLFSAWGGQKIDRFLSPSGVAAVPGLSGLGQYQEQGGINNLYDIHNAMIAPLVPYGIRGAIWYQGEANAPDGDLYRYKMQALMRGWRQEWGQKDLSFDYVQLASYSTAGDWPGLREAQRGALSEKDSGMAVTIDIGDAANIHPANKQDVGIRLAQWTLFRDLQQPIPYSGPLFYDSVVQGSEIRILFDHAESGLIVGVKEGTNAVVETAGPLEDLEIAGTDRVFVSAVGVVDADTLLVSSPSVSEPVHVRYCYQSAPAGSNKLYNAAGFPASPFRTDPLNRLDVVSGSGSGVVDPGGQQVIVAAAPPAGQVFDRWIGAAAEIENVNGSTTTVTMPGHALYLLASYRDAADPVYTLTVGNGYGSGTSQAGSILNIEAAAPPAGQIFDHWSGDTQHVANAFSAVTTLRMPAAILSVAAEYGTVDTVGDGISDVWRNRYFPAGTNSASQADADPDGDGLTNLQEFLAGTSPTNAASVVKLNGAMRDGTSMAFNFHGIAGKRYRLESTDNLLSVSWMPRFFNIFGDDSLKKIGFPMPDSSQSFYRLKSL